ncbi:MAG: flagellar biosynthesis protein FlgE [Pseudomonadota bacterium]
MIESVLQTGLTGLQKSQQQMNRAATDLANGGMADISGSADASTLSFNPTDSTTSLVALKQGEHLFNASAKVVGTADATLGTLLDVMA